MEIELSAWCKDCKKDVEIIESREWPESEGGSMIFVKVKPCECGCTKWGLDVVRRPAQ